MKILVTGATGFIASHIVTDLILAGHTVTCGVRNIGYASKLFPDAKIIPCDFINDTDKNIWIKRLKGIDAVINCVGIFYHPDDKIIWRIHYDTPRALFDACVEIGIKKVIQISALGVDKNNTPYSMSKKSAEDYLMGLPIKSIILRPSLVYGKSSYGGTSLFRGLAGLPKFLPVPGKGEQNLQPIHLQDLSNAILHLIEKPIKESVLLNAVGPQSILLKELLSIIRTWLGFPKAKFISIPLFFFRIVSFIGSFIPYSTINSTSYSLLLQNNITTQTETEKFSNAIDFKPKDFKLGLYSQPSSVQDHWHARLFFLKPLLQISIALLWIYSGITSLFLYPKIASYGLLTKMGIGAFWQPILFYGASFIDLALGFAMLFGFQLRKICQAQILFILIYTFLVTWKLPELWLHPFTPIPKNIIVVIATLVFLAMESDR